MDPLSHLPMEIRLEIIRFVRAKESMAALIRASPALLQPWLAVKNKLLRSLVAADLDDELMQHAVAIVQFPERTRVAKEHLAAWNKRQLPNPLQDHCPEIFEKVNKLHSLILRLMQDYITKATSHFPPREYLCLPNMHASAADGHSLFRGQRITISFRTDVLTGTERRRFLKAFLLFELNCKVVKSGLGSQFQPMYGSRYETPKVLIPLRDDDALRCIHTYVCSLHGAIFAQCGDAWLPDSPNESSLEPGLLHPDNLYLNPNTYMSDLGIPHARGGELAAEFAKYGLDLVVELLSYDISDPQQKESLLFRLEDFWDLYPRLHTEYRHLIVEVSADLVDGGLLYFQLNRELATSVELQKKIFEQRAWVFFDDARLYPTWNTASHFPSASFLVSEPDKLVWFEGWEHNSIRIRALCRSQKWHDDYKKEMDV